MPDFPHKIHAVQDSDGVTQEIVPLGLQNNGYTATLPTLSADATIALTSDIPTQTIDTAISTSSTNAVQNKAIPLYIAARGENLLTNGTALMGNNYNFSALTYDGSDTYYAGGCFKHVGGRIALITDEYMPVDVSQTYELSYYAKSSSATSTLYDYLAMYDIDKNMILARHIMWIAGSTTTLARELKNGDTVVYLTSVAGFNSAATATYQKGLIFWNYTNSFGYKYDTETYSRKVFPNIWEGASSFNSTNNSITLKSAWTGGTFPAGTSVSQCNDGGTYSYITTGPAGTTNWFRRRGLVSGVGKNNQSFKFREGTAFVRLGWLIDQNSEANVTWKLSTLSVAKNIPTVNDAALTIQRNGTTIATFSANQNTPITANITVPTTLDDISDGSTRALSKYLPRSGGTANPLTAPVYINHADLSFIGTAGGFGFRAAAQSGQSVPHLGQINLSKNFGGDGNQYGIQMSAVDITNNKFNQFRVYQSGIAYQQYNNASGATTNVFTVDTTGMLKTLSDIYEGGTKLSDKYLGINDQAKDSDKLDGHDSTYFQTALSAQTAYSAKGSATKVPQITTNSLGQVTGITEIAITDNNQTVKVGSTTFAANATVNFAGSGAASVSANNSSNTITITVPTGTTANTVAVGNHTHGYYTKPTGGIPSSDLAESYYLASNPSGFTSNTGTVKSVRVQAGTGLYSSTSTAQSTTLNTTISIASGYKLPTTTEWNSKANTSALSNYLKQGSHEYGISYNQGIFTIELIDQDGNNTSKKYDFKDSRNDAFRISDMDESGYVTFGVDSFSYNPTGADPTTVNWADIATKQDLDECLKLETGNVLYSQSQYQFSINGDNGSENLGWFAFNVHNEDMTISASDGRMLTVNVDFVEQDDGGTITHLDWPDIATKTELASKYEKPSGGIPASDLAESYYLSSNPSGFTSNTGTVKSVRVQAGTGLSSSTSTAQSTTLNTTISIASGYKLPTTTEWNSKANTSALNKYLPKGSEGDYQVGYDQGYFYVDVYDGEDYHEPMMKYRFNDNRNNGFAIYDWDASGYVSFGVDSFNFTPTGANPTTIAYSDIATKTELGATHWDGAILNLFSDGRGNVVSFYGSLHYLKADRTLSVKGVIRVRAQGPNASSVQEIPITPIYNKLGLSASNVDSTQGLHWIGTGIPWNGTDIVPSLMGAGEIIFLAQGLQTIAIGYISNVNSGQVSLLPISSIATASHMVDFMIHFTA